MFIDDQDVHEVSTLRSADTGDFFVSLKDANKKATVAFNRGLYIGLALGLLMAGVIFL